jgi:hypothetical protein
MSNALRDVEDVLPEHEMTDQQATELNIVASGCRNTLEKLEETLKKYHGLNSGPMTTSSKLKRVWKRLEWAPEDIKELRSRIISNVTLLNAFYGRLFR